MCLMETDSQEIDAPLGWLSRESAAVEVDPLEPGVCDVNALAGLLGNYSNTGVRTHMGEIDPHIHVEQKVAQAGAGFRNVVTSLLGVVPDQPSVVATGCGRQVPYAMTSSRPESVTCLACREHAHREYLRLADQFQRMGDSSSLAIAGVTEDQLTEAVKRLRDLATRFSG